MKLGRAKQIGAPMILQNVGQRAWSERPAVAEPLCHPMALASARPEPKLWFALQSARKSGRTIHFFPHPGGQTSFDQLGLGEAARIFVKPGGQLRRPGQLSAPALFQIQPTAPAVIRENQLADFPGLGG